MAKTVSVLKACKPRQEVLKGELTDAMFGADFGAVVLKTSKSKIYSDAKTFFQNTYPTAPLKKITSQIFTTLAKGEAGRAFRLSTGFGGGKSHALIALWHLAKNISDTSIGDELLPADNRPAKATVAAIDCEKLGTKKTEHENLITHSLWGELAYQIGGKKVHDLVASSDDPYAVPDSQIIAKMLGSDPILILMDEIVVYLTAIDGRAQKAVQVFLRKLLTEVTNRKGAVMVLTDPAAQLAYDEEAKAIESVIRTVLRETGRDA